MNWPTRPEGDGAPAINAVMGDPAVAPHAALLLQRTHGALEGDDEVKFQVVVPSALGAVTLPCVIEQFDGSHRILYSHKGAFDDGDLDRLLQWAFRVRAAEAHHRSVIELVHDADAPAEALDIVSQKPSTLLSLLDQPYLSPDDPSANADLMVSATRHLYGEELSYDEAGLAATDRFIIDRMGPVPDRFSFRPTILALVGSFLGETCARLLDGRWTAPMSDDIPPWMSQVEVGGRTLSPMAHASHFLRAPEVQPGLVAFLTAVLDPGPLPAPASSDAQEGQLPPSAKQRIYRVLCSLAHADGEVDPSERECLEDYRIRLGLDPATAEDLEDEGATGARLQLGRGADERQFLILAMVSVVAADDVLHEHEERRLADVGGRLGLDVGMLLSLARRTVARRAEKKKAPPDG